MYSLGYFYCFLFSCVVIPQAVLSKGQLKSLNEETWSDMLTGEWMVEFYAPWCPACQQLQPLWKEFAEWSDDLGIKVGDVEVTLNPGLSGRFMIAALPTIFHVKDGVFRQYRGARDKDSFISFIEEKKWQNIDPVPSWKSPQSFQMSTVSAFFRLSMLVRSTQNSFLQDYGIPYWGSYIIFGLVVISIGAFIGLLVVCTLDFINPRTSYQPLQRNANADDAVIRRKDESEGEYEGEDIIKEDVGDAEIRRRKEPKSPK
ncbi:thioredoxin-related transmembrane protein 1 [Nephila pilipes]|uniref:Thioredoxin-related transmembrane protein 1 n=1 Tax=Nephila pilipes TaxID=299642 RepID=A0A8X6NUH1_NEPPI|nr:thioredoxin-related transmembrane protein 1 [Nephila pilipes]